MTLVSFPPNLRAPIPTSPDTAVTLVQQGWNSAQTHANQSLTTANTLITQIGNAASQIAAIDTAVQIPAFTNALNGLVPNVVTPQSVTTTAITSQQIPVTIPSGSITPPNILPPNIALIFTEQGYTNAGLSALQGFVNNLLGGTGLPAAVEAGIWGRAVSRETLMASRKSKDIVRAWASRGFQKPAGMMVVELAEAAQSVQDAAAQASREVAIKQADLVQANTFHALEVGLKINEALIAYTNNMMARQLENLKLQLSKELAVFEANLKIYEQTVKAQVSQTELNIEVAKAQTVVAGEQAKLNVEVAKANTTLSVEAAKANASIAAEVSKANASMSVEVTKANAQVTVEIAKANVEVARGNIQAKLSQAQIVMEAAKAGATVSAQLAASAMSSVNLSGSIGSSHSTTDGTSTATTVHHGVVHAGEGPMRTEHTSYNSPTPLTPQ